jgi:hypothetical protein
MKQTNLLKLFISCPSDITSELDSIRLLVDEINKTTGKQGGYIIDTLNWDIDTYTAIGTDAQDAINNQIEDEYDILVSLIWQKLGTPTKRDKSGTVEEINRALDNPTKLSLIYFKTTIENLNEIDLNELQKINEFKSELSSKGVLYKEFNSTPEFETKFRINLTSLISDYLKGKVINTNITPSQIDQNDKYSELDEFLEHVENQDESNLDIDIFNLVEEGLTYLNNITLSMNTFTSTIEDFGHRLTSRTDELNKYKHIKDERLKMSKSKTVINLLAGELDDLTSRLRTELPIFTENFRGITTSYPKILYAANHYENEEVEELKTSVKEFRDAMDSTTNEAADFIRIIMKWPPVNNRFNHAKRDVELVLKDLWTCNNKLDK